MNTAKITPDFLAQVRRILESRPVVSQRQLANLLEVEGITGVSQPSLSRALKRLGAIKKSRSSPYELSPDGQFV